MKLELSNLAITYGDFEAVRDVNLHIAENEFFTILGPSGSGKSTIMRAITGFNTVSQGSIVLDGEDITKLSPEKRAIGMVFQNYALFPTMSVYENIAYGLKLQKQTKQQIMQRVHEVAEMVQLPLDGLQKGISELSGGQQQRVAIARSLAPNPSLLLLDEPLSNLDARLRVELRKELKRLQRELKMTIIYVTHDQNEALTLSDHIAVVHDGNIEQIGTPKEIYQTPQTDFVANFIGEINQLTPTLVTNLQLVQNSEPVHHYVRPEDINFERGSYQLHGQIVNKEYYGAHYNYTIAVADALLDVLAETQFDFEPADEVTIYFDAKHVLVLPGDNV